MWIRKHWQISSVVIVAVAATVIAISSPSSSSKAQDKKDPPADHAAAADPASDDLKQQIAELHAKVGKMEDALKQGDKGGPTDKQEKPAGETPGGLVSAKFQNCVQCHQTRPSGPLPASHLDAVAKKDVGAKQDGMAAMGDKKTPQAGKAGMGMGMMEGKGMGMMEGKGMGMMEGKGMGAMAEKKKAAGMGTMDMGEKKGTGAMGGGKAGMGGSTTGTIDQQMMQMMQQMMEMKMEMMEMKMMEMKMKMMEMKTTDKGMGTAAVETPPDPHAGHKVASPGMSDTVVHPREVGGKADADKDLPTQVRELQVRIAALEAALKQSQKPPEPK